MGYAGNTGATLLGTLALLGAGALGWADVPSSLPDAWLPSFSGVDFVYGGWDVSDRTVYDVLCDHALIPTPLRDRLTLADLTLKRLTPVATLLDFTGPFRKGQESGDVDSHSSMISREIEAFGEIEKCDNVIVLYLGSPARQASPTLGEVDDWQRLLKRRVSTVPASLLYVVAALKAGADFIDFTPSEALTCPTVLAESYRQGVQIAGRDGSTGQTMLKASIATMLTLRGLRLKSWYSSNHLGNRDGLVLSDPDFSWLKLSDKKRFLQERLGDRNFEHVVSVDYVRFKGDRKESFDSIVAEDIFGQEIRLRLNWEAWDSALAVPMLLDIIRLISLGRQLGFRGVQDKLGFFFKSPVGTNCESPEQAHRILVDFYGPPIASILDAPQSRPCAGRADLGGQA